MTKLINAERLYKRLAPPTDVTNVLEIEASPASKQTALIRTTTPTFWMERKSTGDSLQVSWQAKHPATVTFLWIFVALVKGNLID